MIEFDSNFNKRSIINMAPIDTNNFQSSCVQFELKTNNIYSYNNNSKTRKQN